MSDLVRLALPHIEKFENAKSREGWEIVECSVDWGPDKARARIVFQSPDDWGVSREEEWDLYRVGQKRIEGYLMSASLILEGAQSGRIDAPDALLSPAPVLLIELTGEEEPPSCA